MSRSRVIELSGGDHRLQDREDPKPRVLASRYTRRRQVDGVFALEHATSRAELIGRLKSTDDLADAQRQLSAGLRPRKADLQRCPIRHDAMCEDNTWDKAPITTGVHATGSSCDRPDIPVFAMSTSDDGYLIECDPATRVWSRHQG
jgi:hypothetical protein